MFSKNIEMRILSLLSPTFFQHRLSDLYSSIVFVEKKLAFLFPMKGNICSRRFIVYTVFLVPEKQKKTGEERERLSDRSKRNKTRGKKAKEFCLEFRRKLLMFNFEITHTKHFGTTVWHTFIIKWYLIFRKKNRT